MATNNCINNQVSGNVFNVGNTYILYSDGQATKQGLIQFSARLSEDVVNFAGDNGFYEIICDDATINYGGGYSTTTGMFTAPATGIYSFFAQMGLFHPTDPIVTSSIGLSGYRNLPTEYAVRMWTSKGGSVATNDDGLQVSGCFLLNMSEGDTAGIIALTTGASKTLTLAGDTNNFITGFSGYLVG